MTPISGQSNHLNPDLVIFEDRADTKLLKNEGADKKHLNSNLVDSEPISTRPNDVQRQLNYSP